jgi:single-strand DNA-binding protein
MPGLNKIMIIGNVGRDPEMRYAPSGSAVTSFSVATSRTYTANGEKKEETEWFTVEAWNRLAEIANQYVSKGRKIYVEGRFHLDTWSGNDGQQRSRAKITATDFQLLDQAGGQGMREEGSPVGARDGGMDPEDLPF